MTTDQLSDGLANFDNALVNAAKNELYPGHGVDTGTLQRSIHAGGADYPWGRDHVEPDAFTPERSGGLVLVTREENRLMTSVGSGQQYAKVIHDRYQYVIFALVKTMTNVAQFFGARR